MTALYDDSSFDYQSYWRGRTYEDRAEKIALKKFLQIIPKKGTILDIGAGFGRLTPQYAPLFKKSILLDPSQKLLSQAKKLQKKYPNLILKRGVVEKLPEEAGSVDVVLTVRTFHHLKNPQRAVAEIFRVLKPGGFLILEFANKIRFKNILKAIFTLNFSFFTNHQPVQVGKKIEVPFFSYHPNQIKTLLLASGFRIIKTLSVSNFRHPLIKKIIPLKILLWLEDCFSSISAHFSLFQFWGPSIFILAQKKK